MDFSGGINSAILRYVGAEEEEPTTPLIDFTAPLKEADLIVSGHFAVFKLLPNSDDFSHLAS